MNERIKELIAKATSVQFAEGIGPKEVFDKEKFAELLIKECITAITNDDLAKDCGTFLMQSWAKGMRYSAEVIKEHFGAD